MVNRTGLSFEERVAQVLLIAADTWSSRKAAPNNVKQGSALVYLDGSVYALRGDGKKDFWRFDAANSGWTVLADVPKRSKKAAP